MKWTAVVIAFLVIQGCSSSSPLPKPEEQACLDTADAVAKAAQRCGADYHASYDEFVRSGAGGNCANIAQIRDETALRQTCIPSLATISCADLRAAKLDATCHDQLLRPAGLEGELAPAHDSPMAAPR